MDDGAAPAPRQKVVPSEHEDTDVEFHSNVGPYKTPVALQKKKKIAPVVKSSDSEGPGEDSQSEIQVGQKLKANKKGQRPLPSLNNAAQVRQDQLIVDNEKSNLCPNIETINHYNGSSQIKVSNRKLLILSSKMANLGLNCDPESSTPPILSPKPLSARNS